MTHKLKNLPSFNSPPVVEVVAGIQFDQPADIKTIEFNEMWELFGKKDYPRCSEVPPLDPLPRFDGRQIIRFDLSAIPPSPRYWFETEKFEGLIQVQKDRYIYNWRKDPENPDSKYPRYEQVSAGFFRNYEFFKKVIIESARKSSAPIPKPQVLELAYVNIIEMPPNGLDGLGDIFKINFDVGTKTLLPSASFLRKEWRFSIDELKSVLKIIIEPVNSAQTGNPLIKVDLNVTGPCESKSSETENQYLNAWFECARYWIVQSFADITTEKMHKIWERTS